MSYVVCDRCQGLIDSDDDPSCFVEPPACTPDDLVKRLQEIVCEPCREAAWDQYNERLSEEAI